jgi:hypothetical protein
MRTRRSRRVASLDLIFGIVFASTGRVAHDSAALVVHHSDFDSLAEAG